MKYPLIGSLNTNFKIDDKYKKYIDKQINVKKDFFLSEYDIPVSKEYPENEASPNVYNEVWDKKPQRDGIHLYMPVIANLCKKYSPDIKHVLEVGAGFGNLAQIIIEQNDIFSYTAYEFSKAYKKMEERFDKVKCDTQVFSESFKNCKNIEKFDCIIAAEVLEHISWDIEFLSKVSKDANIYFSVPVQQAKDHVRAFLLPESVWLRYKDILDIFEIKLVCLHKGVPKWWCVAAKKK